MKKKVISPPFLVMNPYEKKKITQHVRTNLDKFRMETFLEYIFNDVFTEHAIYCMMMTDGVIASDTARCNDEGDLHEHIK